MVAPVGVGVNAVASVDALTTKISTGAWLVTCGTNVTKGAGAGTCDVITRGSVFAVTGLCTVRAVFSFRTDFVAEDPLPASSALALT